MIVLGFRSVCVFSGRQSQRAHANLWGGKNPNSWEETPADGVGNGKSSSSSSSQPFPLRQLQMPFWNGPPTNARHEGDEELLRISFLVPTYQGVLHPFQLIWPALLLFHVDFDANSRGTVKYLPIPSLPVVNSFVQDTFPVDEERPKLVMFSLKQLHAAFLAGATCYFFL